jgi:hypothetical protein
MTETDVDEVNVPPVPEPDVPDEGFVDPADTYTEGR